MNEVRINEYLTARGWRWFASWHWESPPTGCVMLEDQKNVRTEEENERVAAFFGLTGGSWHGFRRVFYRVPAPCEGALWPEDL